MVECNICGEEFDTERGMKIHRTEVHSSNKTSGEESKSESDSSRTGRVDLNPKLSHLMLAVLSVGLVTGGFAGYLAADALNMAQGQESTITVEDGNNPSPSGTQGSQDTGNTDSTGLTPSEISLKGEPVKGQEDAPLTLLVYEDLQCPFCKDFEDGAMPQIVENYVETGKVKLVWKDRPLPNLHPWAKDGAATMECVYREGGDSAFWSVKNQVFDNQDSISTSNVQSKIKRWAAQEGVSESAIQNCLDNGNPMDEVETDSKNGQKIGASGTPTVFVGDNKLVGAQPYSRFKNAIDQALN